MGISVLSDWSPPELPHKSLAEIEKWNLGRRSLVNIMNKPWLNLFFKTEITDCVLIIKDVLPYEREKESKVLMLQDVTPEEATPMLIIGPMVQLSPQFSTVFQKLIFRHTTSKRRLT